MVNLLHSLHTENEASGFYLFPVLYPGALSPRVLIVCRREIVFAWQYNFNGKLHANRRGSVPPNARQGPGNFEINRGSDSD